MRPVRAVLDDLAAGTITLDQAAADFRARTWPPLPVPTEAQAWGVADDTPAHPESWGTVSSDSRLTTEQYTVLAQAYVEATKR